MRVFFFLLWLFQMIVGFDFFFVLVGKWHVQTPVIPSLPVFLVNKDTIESISDSGCLIMKKKEMHICSNNTVVLQLESLNVKKRPKDWYNLSKYAHFLNYYQRIRRHGLRLDIQFYDQNRIGVNCSSDGLQFGHLVLQKME